MPGRIADIDTPAILIEKKIMKENLRRMQSLADSRGIKLRVHIKSHKIPELARKQLRLGAIGIATAKIGEAEIMAASGIRDIQIANIVTGKAKIKRLLRLHRTCRLDVSVDSFENARELSRAFAPTGRPLEILIKANSGLNRSGFDSYDAISKFIKAARALPGIKIIGLMTHAGHAYGASNRDEIRKIGLDEGRLLVDYARRLKNDGYEILVISVGSTPTARYCSHIKGVTELRVGNYIFNDMTQVALGTVPRSRCALTVTATVISVHSGKRVILDAGSKSLGLDRGAHGKSLINNFGFIPATGDTISRLSEEHGLIDNPKGKYRLGDKIRIIPNHACTVMNLFDYAYLVDNNRLIQKLAISARGKVT